MSLPLMNLRERDAVLRTGSLSPPLLGDIIQPLLQLANFFYAILSSIGERPHSRPLPNRLGLCNIINSRISGSSEILTWTVFDSLKVAYIRRGEFSLRDFPYAFTNLLSDVFLPTYNSSGDVSSDALKHPELLYS